MKTKRPWTRFGYNFNPDPEQEYWIKTGACAKPVRARPSNHFGSKYKVAVNKFIDANGKIYRANMLTGFYCKIEKVSELDILKVLKKDAPAGCEVKVKKFDNSFSWIKARYIDSAIFEIVENTRYVYIPRCNILGIRYAHLEWENTLKGESHEAK